ncbi:MAG TPA: hypothetical protein QKA08_01765 [Candidatus Megaira endosymbiont of Nemacystus decipiens]|nr:hypothetical protein [Candidatus Megaera endosymbiont of Nemacystus decipiens]
MKKSLALLLPLVVLASCSYYSNKTPENSLEVPSYLERKQDNIKTE